MVTTVGVSPYRPDIDGLRGLAVLAVVLFHAFPAAAPGGFVGVDVFFVISGFLITRIIVNELGEGTFTFSGFYARRIRRIFPALAVVLAASLTAGWFWLYADGLKALATHAAAGVMFISNFALWRESGYFDAAGDTKPLLHLWSIGIEEQFYLAWPLLLYAAWRRRWSLAWLTAALAGASFFLNIYQTRIDLVGPFYSPLTRVWELLAGALLVFALTEPWSAAAGYWNRLPWWLRSANARAAGGLALIGLVVCALDRTSHFPRWWALAPTVGAMLLISAGPGAWLSREVLSRHVMVFAGSISYPLYLWHWPLLSFARIVMGETPSLGVRIILVLISVVLAWLTFKWLEFPVRFGWAREPAVPALVASMAVILVACVITGRTGGWPERAINRSNRSAFLQYYDRMHRQGIAEAYRAECDFMDWQTGETRTAIAAAGCTTPGASETWFLWGDSYAQALSAGLRAIAPAGTTVAQVATSHCRPSLANLDAEVAAGRCPQANAFALHRIGALQPEVVVLAQKDSHLETDWQVLSERLVSLGVERVILVGPVPRWGPSLPEVVATHYWDSPVPMVAYGLDPHRAELDRALRVRTEQIRGLTYVSVIDRLCNGDGCVGVLPAATGRELLAFDSGHLTPKGSVYVARQVLRPVLVTRP